MRLFGFNNTGASARRLSAPRKTRLEAAAAVAVVATIVVLPAGAQLAEVLEAQIAADAAAAASQQRINDLTDRTQDAATRYAQAKAEAESFEQYNEKLSAQVRSQEAEIASIEQQLLDIETTNREVQPLMEQMVRALDQFVSLDVPFLLDERTERVENLESLMARADISISEKYRLILEAYQIELDMGRTIGAYEGTLGQGENRRTVQFVRVGRTSLMYQTLDGEETGYWDAEQETWVVDNSYAAAVEQAMRVANQEGAPELLTIPVPAPQEVQS